MSLSMRAILLFCNLQPKNVGSKIKCNAIVAPAPTERYFICRCVQCVFCGAGLTNPAASAVSEHITTNYLQLHPSFSQQPQPVATTDCCYCYYYDFKQVARSIVLEYLQPRFCKSSSDVNSEVAALGS